MVKVRFSSAIQAAANNELETSLEFEGKIADLLNELAKKYGENFRKRAFDAEGKPRKFINIYINGKDARFIKGIESEVKKEDVVDLIPAVSGG